MDFLHLFQNGLFFLFIDIFDDFIVQVADIVSEHDVEINEKLVDLTIVPSESQNTFSKAGAAVNHIEVGIALDRLFQIS
jgi:hypothetical protein